MFEDVPEGDCVVVEYSAVEDCGSGDVEGGAELFEVVHEARGWLVLLEWGFVAVIDGDLVVVVCYDYSGVVVLDLEDPVVEPADVEVSRDHVFWSGRVNHFGLLVVLPAGACGNLVTFLKWIFLWEGFDMGGKDTIIDKEGPVMPTILAYHPTISVQTDDGPFLVTLLLAEWVTNDQLFGMIRRATGCNTWGELLSAKFNKAKLRQQEIEGITVQKSSASAQLMAGANTPI